LAVRVVLSRQLVVLATFTALTLLAAAAAPAYMRWYAQMRRPGSDQRRLCLPDGGGDAQEPSAYVSRGASG